MCKILTAAALSAFLLFSAPSIVRAEELTSGALIEKAMDRDGAEITYTGEVIGDILRRGGHAWINVSDGANAVGIWVSTKDADKITHIGRYAMRGDTVRVTGVFHRACPEHGGDLDIHAAVLEVTVPGHPIGHPAAAGKAAAAAILCAACAALFIAIGRSRPARHREDNGRPHGHQ